jgi:hypothetical protein
MATEYLEGGYWCFHEAMPNARVERRRDYANKCVAISPSARTRS